ncbi:ABC transporter ATP-binding protein [Falsarthrobacter nasiphocae]|uniref:Biotin transport system ATP-binding protein n=1 Tax=Falsarthrobacter nasiphocae TaxID=189863 RepID=A0AAE3YFB3_9MICC|nr:ABC transporter ATP-binding protein [Falsarthrobacter nasiphocae]MDR6891140.1 biotin transport system ATP-binding protein [Falsarthrobacter nasiphocae]
MTELVRMEGVVVEGDDRLLLDVPHLVLDSPRTAVIGPNGSGKSTLLRLLNGLTAPTRGQIAVLGTDVVENTAAARQLVGFVFSDPLAQLLLPTPLEDVRLSIPRLRGRAQAEAARTWLARCGAEHLAEASVYELSSGERQRVALASVLAAEPSLLVLDEPTTLLDRLSVRRLMRLLDSLAVPVLLATHDLEIASAFPRVLAVEDGRIVDDGPGGEVVPAYVRRVDAMDGSPDGPGVP